MKCDACGFFDCGGDCRCCCHEKYDSSDVQWAKKHSKKAWTRASERTDTASFEGLSTLFG